MIGRAWWDNLAVAIMRGTTTTIILRKLSWLRWSTISHWLVVRMIAGIGYWVVVGVVRMAIILRRVSTSFSLIHILLILGIAPVAARTILIHLRMVVLMVTPLRISHNWWKPKVFINLIEVGFSLHMR